MSVLLFIILVRGVATFRKLRPASELRPLGRFMSSEIQRESVDNADTKTKIMISTREVSSSYQLSFLTVIQATRSFPVIK